MIGKTKGYTRWEDSFLPLSPSCQFPLEATTLWLVSLNLELLNAYKKLIHVWLYIKYIKIYMVAYYTVLYLLFWLVLSSLPPEYFPLLLDSLDQCALHLPFSRMLAVFLYSYIKQTCFLHVKRRTWDNNVLATIIISTSFKKFHLETGGQGLP